MDPKDEFYKRNRERIKKRNREYWRMTKKDKIQFAFIILGFIALASIPFAIGFDTFEEIVINVMLIVVLGFWIYMIFVRNKIW